MATYTTVTDDHPGSVGRGHEADPGDRASGFAAFYRESLPRVYGYLLHRCGGQASTAEDLTQETYLAAVRELKKSPSGVELSVPWLIGVARHKFVDHLRRLEREERKLTLVRRSEPGADGTEPWEEGTVDQALAALSVLPSFQRAALVLRYLDDLPVPEVARALGRSVHATESLLARGRSGLRRQYGEADHG